MRARIPVKHLSACRLRGEPFDWGDDRRPGHQSDAVIYEFHVRGFTNNPNSGVSPTCAALSRDSSRRSLLEGLGVTPVQLMPVFQFDPQEGSWWGYSPLSFCPPPRLQQPPEIEQHNEFLRHGESTSRRRHRGHPGCGLQPHGRGRPARAGLQLQGNRQQHLLPDVRQARKPLRELLRNREHRCTAPIGSSAR